MGRNIFSSTCEWWCKARGHAPGLHAHWGLLDEALVHGASCIFKEKDKSYSNKSTDWEFANLKKQNKVAVGEFSPPSGSTP